MYKRKNHVMVTSCQSIAEASCSSDDQCFLTKSINVLESNQMYNNKIDGILSPERHKGIFFKPQQFKCTKSKPFSFEARDTAFLKRRADRIQKSEHDVKLVPNSHRSRSMRIRSQNQLSEIICQSHQQTKPIVKLPNALHNSTFYPPPSVLSTPNQQIINSTASRLKCKEGLRKRKENIENIPLELKKIKRCNETVHKPAFIHHDRPSKISSCKSLTERMHIKSFHC